MKITALLFLEAIEPALAFWVDRIGFTKTVEVPHEGKIGFCILNLGDAEVMLQTFASAEADSEAARDLARQTKASLFIEVDNFADIEKRLAGWPVAMPVRDTFYGMREIGVYSPGGHFLCFAAKI